MTGELIIAIVLLFIVLPMAYAAWIGAPLVATPKRAVRLMIQTARLKPGEIAYDLGAGTGKFIIIGKKESNLDIRGIELPPVLWLLGRINLRLHGISAPVLERGNFFKKDLRDVGVCFSFLMPKTLMKMKAKFEQELKKERALFLIRFPLRGGNQNISLRKKESGQSIFTKDESLV